MHKNSLFLLLSLILGLSLVSCNNFLKATEVKDDIEQHIAYANAKSYLVKVNSREGTGTVAKPASGEALKKETDVFEIKFEPLPDFEFVSWQASSSKLPEGQNINDYIEIEDARKAETRVTFKKALEDIVITATVAERAQIISYSPMTSEVLKDSSVLVQFDHDMNVDSIYYTQNEMDKLKLSNQNINFIPSKRTPGRFYGYKIGDEPFYKNISFVDNETETNLTSCYDEPYFANPKMLTINTVKDKPLDDYTPILVTIDKNFFYTFDDSTETGKAITMTGSKKWTYQVNDQVDDDLPRFLDPNDIKIAMNAGQPAKTELSYTNTAPTISADTLFNRDKKINLNIKLTDLESGPDDEFFIVLSRIQDEKYDDITTPEEAIKSVSFQRVTSQKGLINKDVDLSTVFAEDFCDENSNGLFDGVYKMSFIFKDRAGKTLSYPSNKAYYFTVDNTPPDVSIPSISSQNKTTYKVTWNKDSIADYKEAIVSDGAGYTSSAISGNNTDLTINNGEIYEVKVTIRDFAGNEVVKILPKFLTGLEIRGTPDFKGENASQINGVFLENDCLSYYGLSLITYWSDGSSEDSTSDKKIPTVSNHTTKTNISYEYTYNGVKKTAKTSSTYYFAKNDAITNKPVKLVNYTGSSINGTYYKFGDFPQTIASNQVTYTSNKVYNDWYLGTDGYFYEKCKENAYYETNEYKYSDGSSARKESANNYRYFKVEPIKWRVLTENYDNTGNSLLYAENGLTANVPFYAGSERTLGSLAIYTNNYKYSNIRAYLNSTKNQFVIDGGSSNDYTINLSGDGKGFLQKAFTTKTQEMIVPTNVNNSPSTVTYSSNQMIRPANYNNFFCDNTYDKVFLLSQQEADTFIPTVNDSKAKLRSPSDYAIANYAEIKIYADGDINYSYYALRSPGNDEYRNFGVSASSTTYSRVTNYKIEVVVPALCVATLPQ